MSKNSNIEFDSESIESTNRTSKAYIKYSRLKRKLLAKYTFQVRMISVFIIFSLVVLLLSSTSRVLKSSNAFQIANSFLFTPEGSVNQFQGRTNILILGKSDNDLNTPDITDTMIFASLKISDLQSLLMISIPRDIWVPEINDKINAAYRTGNQSNPSGGLKLAKSTVEKVVGQPIQYAVSIDSSNLAELIDLLGGIDVNVSRSFTDKRFPIPGKENDDCDGDPEYNCRYETLEFKEGVAHMDGETALKFSRSRHSEDLTEGTDFARAARQQKVLNAIKDKVLSADTLTSYSKLTGLYSLFKKSLETDLTSVQIAYLARRVMQANKRIGQAVLPEEFLLNPPLTGEYNYLYVFTPKVGDWSEVHAWIESLL